MEITEKFEQEIAPFRWVEHGTAASVCLNAGTYYLQEIFDTRAAEGFIGNGYDWESLAKVFLEEKYPVFTEKVNFDSEADMFCVYSDDTDALREFICAFKNTCEDRAVILDLLGRAVLD